MLLSVSVVSLSCYAVYEFYQKYSYYRRFMQQQAIQLNETLGKTLANDVYYRNYFNLWSEVQKVYLSNRLIDDNYNLIIVDEISVVGKKNKILAHSNPDKYKLNSNYKNELLTVIKASNDNVVFKWKTEYNKLYVISSIDFNNSIAGYVFISFDMLPLNILKKNSFKNYLISQLILITIIVIVVRVFAIKLSRPLHDIIGSIPDIGSGKIEINYINKRHDEFKILGNALISADKKIYETHNEMYSQKQKLMGILDNSNAVIYMKNIGGSYLLINKHYENLFGLKQEDVLGKTDFDLFSHDIAQKFRNNDVRVLECRCSLNFEEVVELDDGLHTYLTVKFPIKDMQGEVYAVAGISTDITARKHAEDELNEYKDKLEIIVEERTEKLTHAVKEMETFSYSVSHDLRTPLRSINGFCYALQEDHLDQLDETGQTYLSRILRATDRMSDIIDDMLLLSRVSRYDIVKIPVDLGNIAERVIAELKSQDSGRDVKIHIESNMMANVDIKMITIVLENILGNAWKYSAKVSHPEITFGQSNIDNKTVFYVKDNGAGFDMEYVDKIFMVFHRLHGDEFEGTGIGLATVERIIQQHNGEIWAESEIGHGSTFYFTTGD